MNKSRPVCVLCAALLLVRIFVSAQSGPGLRPPAQTYVYDFNFNTAGSVGAVAPVTPALNLGASYSIEFWMMLNLEVSDVQAPKSMRVFDKPGVSSPAYQLNLAAGSHQLTYRTTGFSGATIGVSPGPGQWYHIAIVSDSLQVTLYLNGQQQARFTAPGPPQSNSNPLVFAENITGSLRQFRIWGRALQPAEISSFATKVLAGTEAGLIADWPLDDGQGQTLRDLGPNRLTLNLTHGYLNPTELFPAWMRTAIVDGGPYFQVQKLTVPQVRGSGLTIPIDFDSDGNIDILSCDMQASVTTRSPCYAFHNDGKGNFSDVTVKVLGSDPPSFETPRDYCVADFNGDGRADVFIANTGECPGCGIAGGQSRLLLQTTDGRLQDVTVANLPAGIRYTHNVACGDIDGDGDIDLYLANQNTTPNNVPEIWLNDGQGHFTVGDSSRLPAILLPGSAQPSDVQILRQRTGIGSIVAKFVDVNHDGRLDLFVAANDYSNRPPRDMLLLNDGHGFYTPAPVSALPTRYGGRNWETISVRVVDFDRDGWPDLINTVDSDYFEGAVQILLNNHDGTFRDATDLIVQPAWPRHGSLYPGGLSYLDPVYIADFNGDGYVDLLVQGVIEPSRLFLNTGPAGGGRLVEVTELLPTFPDLASSYAVADFNRDGLPDIAAVTFDCCNPLTLETWLSSRRFAVTPDLIPPKPTGPLFLRGSVLNTAGLSADALAPGELVTVFGRTLGPDTLVVASVTNGAYPTALSTTRVLFNNVAAPLIYASAGAVSAVVPFGVVPQTFADVVIEYQGKQSPPVSIFVAGSAPGLFAVDSGGAGAGAVLNVDSVTGAVSLNSPQNPAPRGSTIVAYITGAGRTDPPSVDGTIATDAGGLTLPVQAGLDFIHVWGTAADCAGQCQPLQVLYAGPAPGIVAGVLQVNMRIPDSPSASGMHFLGVSVGGIWSQPYPTVSIR